MPSASRTHKFVVCCSPTFFLQLWKHVFFLKTYVFFFTRKTKPFSSYVYNQIYIFFYNYIQIIYMLYTSYIDTIHLVCRSYLHFPWILAKKRHDPRSLAPGVPAWRRPTVLRSRSACAAPCARPGSRPIRSPAPSCTATRCSAVMRCQAGWKSRGAAAGVRYIHIIIYI